MTYDISAPVDAPEAAKDLLKKQSPDAEAMGEGLSEEQMRDFVLSLHDQIKFKSRMQEAPVEEVIEYLEKNGYDVVQVEE